ncbi:MAG: hypothetical protein COV73_01975 [Candidatus Omnitrophica bacterium CG11_big_fil_rev_8_21_14_0_20_43_6]|nr:MAG: hypothetical protein COV73_01975 [Candidatus Omnitrophica bacterium CG11_big_fil_rev_8_21_14_0_20_43_6]
MRRGFTLIELIIVIIIVGILATIGMTQYTKVVEKGRAAEARQILGSLRSAQNAYYLEYGLYTGTMANLGVGAGACDVDHFFGYTCAGTGTCTATRCTAAPTKLIGPAYNKTLTAAGVWGGSAGY